MTRLVPALPCELHPQLPGRIGKFVHAGSRELEAHHLVRHVPMQVLAARCRRVIVVLVHVGIAINHGEAVFASWLGAQRDIANLEVTDVVGHQFTASVSMLRTDFSRVARCAPKPDVSFSSALSLPASLRCRSSSPTVRSAITMVGSTKKKTDDTKKTR